MAAADVDRWEELHAMLPLEVGDAGQGPWLDALTMDEIGMSSVQVIEFIASVEDRFGVEFAPEEFLRLLDVPLADLLALIAEKSGS